MRLQGKVCVITGAASGIGAESVRLFDQEGATVVGVDVAPGSGGALALEADVTDERQSQRAFEAEGCKRQALTRLDADDEHRRFAGLEQRLDEAERGSLALRLGGARARDAHASGLRLARERLRLGDA